MGPLTQPDAGEAAEGSGQPWWQALTLSQMLGHHAHVSCQRPWLVSASAPSFHRGAWPWHLAVALRFAYAYARRQNWLAPAARSPTGHSHSNACAAEAPCAWLLPMTLTGERLSSSPGGIVPLSNEWGCKPDPLARRDTSPAHYPGHHRAQEEWRRS